MPHNPRVPRRAGLLALALALGACLACSKAHPTPSEPFGCLRLDGAYALAYSEAACGRSGAVAERLVVINQSGCNVNAVLPGYALLDGTVTGDTLLFSVTLLASSGPCGNAHMSGNARVTSAGGRFVITGTYGTAAAPPAGCACLSAPGSATLTLTQ